ncbi:uncharacterized protein [Palaemon carinicauda]|uniref:uncharacterized protein n=1 Tax=Palaemon carinicauda TaxID=392227 RepID=UPI0035B5B559
MRYLPDGGPIIQGIQNQYLVGDWVDITCLSLKAKPAPYLSFSINGEDVSPGWIEPQENSMDHEGLYTSSIRMRFVLTQRVLLEGQAKIQCRAHIPDFYQETINEVLRTMPRSESLLDGGLAAGDRPNSSSTPVKILTAVMIVVLQHQLAQ